jgi:transposase-like protein
MARRRRKFSPHFKFEAVMEALQGEKTKAQVCREHHITKSLLYRWEQEFLERAPTIFAEKDALHEKLISKDEQIAELERLVGRLALENEVLKKSESWLQASRRRNER